MINYLISILYIAISLFFINNFKKIFLKLKDGKDINKNSLLAASSLVLQFISLAIYFFTQNTEVVLISQLYMLGCIIFLIVKKD